MATLVTRADKGSPLTNTEMDDNFNRLNGNVRYAQVMAVAPATDTAVADGVAYLHIPPALDGMDLVYVHAEVVTAGVTGDTTVQVHNLNLAVDVLSTPLTVDSGETGSDTATAAVINTANDHVATNDVVRIDVDTVSTIAAKGLIVTLGFQAP